MLFRNYLLGVLLKNLGRIEEAFNDYSIAISINPQQIKFC